MPESLIYGRYELLRPLARGGMGIVYLAQLRGPAGVSKRVALKVVDPRLSEHEAFVQLFLEEMRVAMGLSHRNIVQTFDAGRYHDTYYMVMEWMSGGALSALVESAVVLPLDLTLFIGSEIAGALEYAHRDRGGVVHRDVSLGNILLSLEGDVKLSDFGVARTLGRAAGPRDGVIEGKLAYMAPEQAWDELSPRSDIFALGAVLYGLVVGEPLRAQPTLETVRTHPPDLGHLRALRQLPETLVKTIARMLAMAASERPSAAEVRYLLTHQLHQLGPNLDPHGRLRACLTHPGSAPRMAESEQALPLAEAMMALALAVPTDVGSFSLCEQPQEPGAGGVFAAEGAARATNRLSDGARHPPLVASFGLGALLLVLVGAFFLGMRGYDRTFGAADGGGAEGLWALRSTADSLAHWAADGSSHVQPAAAPRRGQDARVEGAVHSPETATSIPTRARPVGKSARVPASRPRARPVRAGAHLQTTGSALGGRAPSSGARRRPTARQWGLLDINSAPWSRVFVDGRYVGDTPLQRLRLVAGWHRLRLVSGAGKVRSLRLKIGSQERVRRSIRFDEP